MMRFADVLLSFGGVISNRPYTYSIPERLADEIGIGDPVWVPFRSSLACGVVVGFPPEPGRPVKSLQSRNATLHRISYETLEFSKWISRRFASSWWEALRGFLIPFEDNGKAPAEAETPAPRVFPGTLSLTLEQEAAASEVKQAVIRREPAKYLLHGVTGSGKTEVYLSCAQEVLRRGKQVLVLVPEIPLSFQLAGRFRRFFGPSVAVLHSGLSDKEKREEESRVLTGQANIVIGPRRALFAPLKNLGLVVMDEEHDPSYKQENSPRYHAFTLAEKLAEAHRAPFLFGSATPSLERYFAARENRVGHLVLRGRYEARSLPRVDIVDLRAGEAQDTRPFSPALLEALRESVESGRQAILFLNRRGFYPLVFCRACGRALHCPSCSITLTYHHAEKLLRCHYCDYRNRVPDQCPDCRSDRLTHRGFGTERLEEKIREHVPQARVARLDRDTASRRGAAGRIIEEFSKGETNVLVGTQMVTKGFDFPNVNLVGIVYADPLLHFPDFRSSERAFQLLTQVSGRTGRGSEPGRVILQTYDPEHPVIAAAARHDDRLFYDSEIESRRRALYPPFVSLANLLLSGPDEPEVEAHAGVLREFLLSRLSSEEKPLLLGPSPSPVRKISKNFRWHLLLKARETERLLEVSREIQVWQAENGSRKVRLSVDIDPVRLL